MAVEWISRKDLMIRIPATIILVVIGKYYKKTQQNNVFNVLF